MKPITGKLYFLLRNFYLIGESRWSSILNPSTRVVWRIIITNGKKVKKILLRILTYVEFLGLLFKKIFKYLFQFSCKLTSKLPVKLIERSPYWCLKSKTIAKNGHFLPIAIFCHSKEKIGNIFFLGRNSKKNLQRSGAYIRVSLYQASLKSN